MYQIHIDLETLGVRPTSRILSIGACATAGGEFYVEIDQSLYTDDFTTDLSTVEWWAKRGGFVPTTINPVTPHAACSALIRWILEATEHDEDFEIWANSPAFDCVKLVTHFDYFGLTTPWGHWQERDVRTIRRLADRLRITLPRRETAHHALQDAKDQCLDVNVVLSTLIQRSQAARDAAFLRTYKLEASREDTSA